MKRTRLLWATGLMATAIAAMLALSTAGAALPLAQAEQAPPPEPVFAPLEIESPIQPLSPSQPTLALAVRSDDIGGTVSALFFDAQEQLVGRVTVDAHIGAACSLVPGADYTARTDNGLEASFRLEENGSVTNVTGGAWSDGEVLHLSAQPRGAVTVLVGVGTLGEGEFWRFTLRGGEFTQTVSVGREDGETQRRLVFSNLDMGTYMLLCPNGQSREITLTPIQNAVSIGLE